MADASVAAGRGVIYIAFAKAYFMIAGYVIYFILPRLLHSEVLWGNYLLAVGLVSVFNNVIVTGTIQAVSKFTAQDDAMASGVKAAALKAQLLLVGVSSVVYLAAATLLARWQRDPGLMLLYWIAAGIMICYSFYAVFVGSLNGLRRFGGQAGLDISFATLRAVLILGCAALGWGAMGAVGGFIAAAGVILLVSMGMVGLPKQPQPFPVRQMLWFMLQLFAYTLALNAIMRVDLHLLKGLVGPLSGVAGAKAQADLASAYAGYYGTAQSLAFIPYQAILAVAFVIFPLVSRSTFENDLATTQAYVRQTLRLSLIFVAGLAVVFMANPAAVIYVPYPEKYRIGATALRVLSAGMVCFSLFTIVNTILNGAGRTRHTIFAGLATLATSTLANWLVIPRAGSPAAALDVAAWASAGSMALGAGLSLALLYREFAAGISLLSVLRIVLAMAVAIGVGVVVPEVSKLVTLGECCLVLVVYYVALVVLRELRGEDLARFKRVLLRRR